MKKSFCILSLVATIAPLHVLAVPDIGDADVQLKLTRLELLLKNKKLSAVEKLLGELKSSGLVASEIYSLEASYYLEKGAIAQSISILEEAKEKFPEDENIRDFLSDVKTNHKSHVRVARIVEILGDHQMEQKWAADTQIVLNNNATKVAAEYIWNDFTTPDFTNIAGNSVKLDDSVALGKISVSHELPVGDELGSFVASSEYDIGAGAWVKFIDNYGTTTVTGTYNVPDWDYIESTSQQGVKDSFSVAREQRFGKRVDSVLSLGVNRYGLDSEKSLVGTYKLDASLGYSFGEFSFVEEYLGDSAELNLTYDISGEYVSYAKRRLDSFAVNSKIYPIDSYEIHSINFNLGKTFFDDLYTGVFGGYSFDRLGGDAPSLGVSVDYEFIDDTNLEFYAVRSLSAENNSEEADAIGVGLKRSF